jgi:hypothetical protein
MADGEEARKKIHHRGTKTRRRKRRSKKSDATKIFSSLPFSPFFFVPSW